MPKKVHCRGRKLGENDKKVRLIETVNFCVPGTSPQVSSFIKLLKPPNFNTVAIVITGIATPSNLFPLEDWAVLICKYRSRSRLSPSTSCNLVVGISTMRNDVQPCVCLFFKMVQVLFSLFIKPLTHNFFWALSGVHFPGIISSTHPLRSVKSLAMRVVFYLSKFRSSWLLTPAWSLPRPYRFNWRGADAQGSADRHPRPKQGHAWPAHGWVWGSGRDPAVRLTSHIALVTQD